MVALQGPGDWEQELRKLSATDIRGPGMSEMDIDGDDDVDVSGRPHKKRKKARRMEQRIEVI